MFARFPNSRCEGYTWGTFASLSCSTQAGAVTVLTPGLDFRNGRPPLRVICSAMRPEFNVVVGGVERIHVGSVFSANGAPQAACVETNLGDSFGISPSDISE